MFKRCLNCFFKVELQLTICQLTLINGCIKIANTACDNHDPFIIALKVNNCLGPTIDNRRHGLDIRDTLYFKPCNFS